MSKQVDIIQTNGHWIDEDIRWTKEYWADKQTLGSREALGKRTLRVENDGKTLGRGGGNRKDRKRQGQTKLGTKWQGNTATYQGQYQGGMVAVFVKSGWHMKSPWRRDSIDIVKMTERVYHSWMYCTYTPPC
jgi:hypothetical protein